MWRHLLAKKSIGMVQQEGASGELKRSLSAWNLVSLGIGCIIGAGIFVMTGQVAAQYAGPAVIISFIIAGLACAFAALCYAELASVLPVSGSAYTYAYTTLGEIFAWIMGWLLLLEYGVAASTVAVGWSGYLVSFLKDFGVMIPPEWANPYGMAITLADGATATGLFNAPAFLSLMGLSCLLVLGVKESATVNNITVVIKLCVIVLFIAVGVFYVQSEHWHPFIPENTGVDGEYGWSGILRAAGVISFAYVGFEAVSTAAQEARNPQKDIPIGILGSLAICTVLYMLVALVLTGIVPFKTLNVPDPIALAVDAIGMPWLAFLIKIGAIVGLFSVMLVLLYGQTRIFYSMSRDGLLPHFFSKVHSRFQTPHINTLIVGLITGIVAGCTPISDLGDLVSLGTLFAFAIICFSVIYLRYTQPELERPFHTPFFPLVPVLGILSCGWLMWGLRSMFVTLKLYFLLGIVIYFAYGQFHSVLKKNARATQ